jgi:uracil-DNA glycosylase family 4
VSRLRPLQACDASGLRLRAARGAGALCWRAAGGPGGPTRGAVRGSGGSIARQGTRRGGHPSRQGLRHQRGQPRDRVYVTNAVKHFKWEPRGKRRIHKKPRMSEVKACRPWLEAELRAVKPDVVVCLGATAAQSVLGSQFKLMAQRGQVLASELAGRVVATIHPSAVLRAPESEGRRAAYEMLVADLKLVAGTLKATR